MRWSVQVRRLHPGAGAVGLAFATALTRHSYFRKEGRKKIAILDLNEPPKLDKYIVNGPADVPEQRTSTLTPSSLRFLTDIGVMQHVNDDRCARYHRMQVWEKDGSSFLAFEHPDKRSMGRTIENSHLVAAMYHLLKQEVAQKFNQDNVDFIFNDEIVTETDGKLKMKSGQLVDYDLLVGSDGQRSKVKEIRGITSHGWSHNQKAIVRMFLMSRFVP